MWTCQHIFGAREGKRVHELVARAAGGESPCSREGCPLDKFHQGEQSKAADALTRSSVAALAILAPLAPLARLLAA